MELPVSRFHKACVLATLILLSASFAVSADKAKLGIATEATISGFFSPKLKRVKITTVVPGSPAALAGLLPGDFIVEANGKKIEGAPAREMAGLLRDVKPGQHLQLRVKRGESNFKDVEVVAGS